MRAGIYSEKPYPLYNCTADTLSLMLKSDDPAVVEVAKLIAEKKRRPRFDVWLTSQAERDDGVGRFARWVANERAEHGRWLGRLYMTDPLTSLGLFVKARWHGIEIPEQVERDYAQSLEEWDRWGV